LLALERARLILPEKKVEKRTSRIPRGDHTLPAAKPGIG